MKVKFIYSAFFLAAVLLFSAVPYLAQESEAVVVDEVVAQVGDGVITLSRVKREMKGAADAIVERDKSKTPEAARAEVAAKQGEIIANLINEELVMQKGKDSGIESDVDAQVNQRFVEIMKQQNLKTLDELYKAMTAAGVKPDEFREGLRKQITKDEVFQRDVDSKVYLGWSAKEVKDYYEAHRDKFTKPETVVLSEIFLGFAGRDMATVRAKADALITQIRGGADFPKLAAENSDRQNAAQTKGSVGSFSSKDLNQTVADAIKNVKVGDVAKIENEEGISIIRVDSRANASSESVFDERAVRTAMTYEKLPDERKKFLAQLRKDAYVKISDTYKAMVAPYLPAEDAKTEAKKSN